MSSFAAARDKGGRFLDRNRFDASGVASGGAGAFGKLMRALQVSGHLDAANEVCDWIGVHAMTETGDLRNRIEDPTQYGYTYSNAWVAVAAARLGRRDVADRAMAFLMQFQNSDTEGFNSGTAVPLKQDVIYTSFCGLAALLTGRTEVARGVGRWLEVVMAAQPEFPERFYTVYSKTKGLETEVPPGESPHRYVVHSDPVEPEHFFQAGAAGGFLAHLFAETNEKRWLVLAKDYLRFAERSNDYVFRFLSAGKLGWASALVYESTGDETYRKIALRVGDTLATHQGRQGEWRFVDERPLGQKIARLLDGSRSNRLMSIFGVARRRLNGLLGREQPPPTMALTGEMVCWLDVIDRVAGADSA